MPEQFDDLVASTDPAMVIVTAVAGETRAGCLVGFHSQCSIDPPRYGVWLSKANRTYRTASEGTYLAVHLLTDVDLELARTFGELTGDEVDKFSISAWHPGPGGVPLLNSCPRRIVLERRSTPIDGGDHGCFVGAVVATHGAAPFTPLRLSAVADLVPGHRPEDRPRTHRTDP